MNEQDRIAHEPCGCRTDRKTGLPTQLCRKHRPHGCDTRPSRELQEQVVEGMKRAEN